MKYKKGTFITVPNKELLRGLDPQSQTLYLWLNSYSNDEGECYPSIERLSHDCKMSKNTVLRRLRQLCKLKLITKQNQFIDNRQTTNLYTMELVEEGATERPPQCHRETPEGATERHRTKSIVTQSTELSYFSEEKLKSTKRESNNTNSLSKETEGGKTEYEVVLTNDEGDEIPQRKPKTGWDKEKAVEAQFAAECVKRGLPKPSPVAFYLLATIRKGLKELTEEELPNFFTYWFDTALPDNVLNVHSMFAGSTINRFRGHGAKQKPKSNSKYDNIKSTKINNKYENP